MTGMSFKFYVEIFKFKHLRGRFMYNLQARQSYSKITISIYLEGWSATNKYIYFGRKNHITGSSSFKSQLKCHPFKEPFLAVLLRYSLWLYTILYSEHWFISLLIFASPCHHPLHWSMQFFRSIFSPLCTWCLISIWFRDHTQYLSGWSQIQTANERRDKIATDPLWFLWVIQDDMECEQLRRGYMMEGSQGG